MSVIIYSKYRCMTCEGTPPIGTDSEAEEHLLTNVGHELSVRIVSEYKNDIEEGES